jgi:AcrR family transcriptional regulator
VTFVKGSGTKKPKTLQNLQTRQRLIDAATTLFAERGFKKVSVREICRAARANVAAVNYHFGSKVGLYREVVKTAIQAMRETNELGERAGEGATPEEQLRAFVRIFLARLTGGGRHAWVHKLMAREMEEPTEALDLVMRQVVQPRLQYLGAIVSAMTGRPADDPAVMRAIASVQMQCVMFARPMPAPMQRVWAPVAGDVDAIAEHIAAFSLAGIRALGAVQSSTVTVHTST